MLDEVSRVLANRLMSIEVTSAEYDAWISNPITVRYLITLEVIILQLLIDTAKSDTSDNYVISKGIAQGLQIAIEKAKNRSEFIDKEDD